MLAEAKSYTSQSRLYWGETEGLLKEVERLQRDTQVIPCPCKKQDCPFRVKNKTDSPTHMLKQSMCTRKDNRDSPRLRKKATYNGFTEAHLTVASTMPLDTVIDEEDTTSSVNFQFKRTTPVKRTKRRHTMLQVSKSLPDAVNSLFVPKWFQNRDLRSLSLPEGSLCSADAMDAEAVARLQQIRRAHLSSVSHGKLSLVHECHA